MATQIQEIMDFKSRTPDEIIKALQKKDVDIPSWATLKQEYYPKLHPVMTDSTYVDYQDEDGNTVKLCRITYDWMRLAAQRMSDLCVAIPVKRVYHVTPGNAKQKEAAVYLENIFKANRIDAVNLDRCNKLFASCETFTLWYLMPEPTGKKNNKYGFPCSVKFKCRVFSPMTGAELYPLYDEYGDLIAHSVYYTRTKNNTEIKYMDCYTDSQHFKFSTDNADKKWALENAPEEYNIGKIPGVYVCRETPIWEDKGNTVYEAEWTISRNGNYLRKNSKPIITVADDKPVKFGKEKEDNKARSVFKLSASGKMSYVTWEQQVENLKFQQQELKSGFFSDLQIPDWSLDNLKGVAISAESRKYQFVDAQLKMKQESGRLIEAADREVNIVKALLISQLGESYKEDIESLVVDNVFTPFSISDDKDTISNLVDATGGKAIMSQREAISEFGHSNDIDRTLQEIADENKIDVLAQ